MIFGNIETRATYGIKFYLGILYISYYKEGLDVLHLTSTLNAYLPLN